MKKREINYGDNTIIVENRVSGERLYVNGELQDEQIGFTNRSRLWGKLQTGEEIKITLGGFWGIQCRVFINNKLVLCE